MDAAKYLGELHQAPEKLRLWGIGEKMHEYEFTFIFPLLGCIGAGNKLYILQTMCM